MYLWRSLLQHYDDTDFNQFTQPYAPTLYCLCKSVTYNNQQNEVDEVVEGMSIHHVVHYLHPALQSDHLQSEGRWE